MFKPTTLSVARPVAETLTQNNIILTPKGSHLPVGVMADHFRIPVDAEFKPLNPGDYDRITEMFREYHESPSEMVEAEHDRLVDLMAHGLESMLNTVRSKVVPVCKMQRQRFEESSDQKRLAHIEITPFNYHAIHNEPALTEHVHSYHNIRGRDTYRTFLVPTPSVETMIEWMSHTNHVDAELVKKWALENVGADDMEVVWLQLFGASREINPHSLDLVSLGRMPFNVDKLLAAYFITSYLCANPQEVNGESVSLEEWEETMATLHRFLGASLCRAYERRARDRQRQRVVISYEADDAIRRGRVIVHVNGDVYPDWLEQGGDVKVLLGAAVSEPNRLHAKDFEGRENGLTQVWERKHYLIRQAKLTNYLRQRREELRFMFLHPSYDVKELLPETKLSVSELEQRVNQQVDALREEDLDDIPRTVTRLVCGIYYPGSPFLEFLETMDQVAQDHSDLPPREVATVAAIEMTASWLSSQVTANRFEARIEHQETRQPEPQPEEEGAVTDEAQVSESA